MKNAIDLSQEHPEGDIFVIPVRLDECETPESVSRWHYVDLFTDNGYEKLLTALETKANRLSNGKLDITGNMAKRNSPKKIIDEVRSVAHELYNQANLALQENQDTLTPALQGLETSREAMQNMIGLFHRQRGRGFYHRWRTYLIELQKKPEANDTIIQELIGNLLSSLDDLIEIFYSTAKDFH